MVRDIRAAGVPVGLATNTTDRLDADLAAFDLTEAFDAVVNSSVLGVAKPHAAFYAAACDALGVAAADCLFVDDSARFVAGARAAGLLAQRFTGDGDVRYVRAAFGV
jgi:putative hydrolase of the HAD superfamily